MRRYGQEWRVLRGDLVGKTVVREPDPSDARHTTGKRQTYELGTYFVRGHRRSAGTRFNGNAILIEGSRWENLPFRGCVSRSRTLCYDNI